MFAAHIIAYYEFRIRKMGSWPMRRGEFLTRIANYRNLMKGTA